MAFEIQPGKSIGPVELGMTRDEARQCFDEAPDTFDRGGPVDAYLGAAFQVCIADGRVNFIEVARDDEVDVVLLAFDPFGIEMADCVERIRGELGHEPQTLEAGTTFRFDPGVVLWHGGDDSGRFTTVAVHGPGYYD